MFSLIILFLFIYLFSPLLEIIIHILSYCLELVKSITKLALKKKKSILKWTRFLVDVLQIIRCQFQLFNLMSTYIYTWWVILYLIIKWIHGSFHVGSTWRNGVCNLRFIVINEFKMFNATLKWIFVDLSWDNVC